ncbi:nucleoside kinase [Spirochaeta lutea]|uniref:AAA+ ATPase domain-containing protein n=1 Tax=Spirochaeta lutea TaxID=1480694 RepID=A0A098R1H8_9SPIO|nr:nucleoside kinase [Spirochaeta lutea]KGE73641.1 hypothetical protein DC28_03135 [Spirochaeta lutea]
MDSVTHTLRWQDTDVQVPHGTTLDEFITSQTAAIPTPAPPILAAKYDSELVDLRTHVDHSGVVEGISILHDDGYRINQQASSFLVFHCLDTHYPRAKYRLSHSIGSSLFFTAVQHPLSVQEIKDLEGQVHRLIGEQRPFQKKDLPYQQAIKEFKTRGRDETVLLLDYINEPSVSIMVLGDYLELSLGPIPLHTGQVSAVSLSPYNNGFLLHLPPQESPGRLPRFEDIPFLTDIFTEYQQWGRILEVHTAGRLNALIKKRGIKEFIWVVETLQNNKIAAIARDIAQAQDGVRVVLIAGPSSSGKTTFAKKLFIQLRSQGLQPQTIGLDDFFVNREDTPLDSHGNPDFESVHAIDLPLLNTSLLALLAGEQVFLPTFDFKVGKQILKQRPLQLSESGILIIEGIHGLNDELTSQIPRDQKFKIYVSALTQINLDEEHRISTTDNRLIRRLVRDYRYRSHDAEATLGMWPSVRRGENRNIFPFQNSADRVFNSAADYELGALKPMAEALLREVKPGSVHYAQARRLLAILAFFLPVQREFVPDQAILREFIGGSVFKY